MLLDVIVQELLAPVETHAVNVLPALQKTTVKPAFIMALQLIIIRGYARLQKIG
jgi:hypothetical protein